jgi:hypothetical protein
MKSKERVFAALAKDQTPDRVPWVEEIFHSNTVSDVLGRDVVDPLNRIDYLREEAMEEISKKETVDYYSQAVEVFQEFGLDGIACPAWTPGICDALIMEGEFFTGAEDPGILDRESFERRGKELRRPSEMPIVHYVEGFCEVMQKNDMFNPLLVGMQYRMLECSIGFENIGLWCIEQPQLLHDIAQFFCDWTCENIRFYLDRFEFDALWLDDDVAFNSGTFLSPEKNREFVFPYHKQIVDVAKSYGLKTMFHADGNLSAIMEDLLDLEFASIHPLEDLKQEQFPFDIHAAREQYGDRVTVMGSVPMVLLESGDPEPCYDYAKNLIDTLGPARFILASGNSVTPFTKTDNLRAMARAVLEQ